MVALPEPHGIRCPEPPKFTGLGNYVRMFTDDDLFWPSLGRTFYYALLSVPTGVLGSLLLAVLLNAALRGIAVFRTLFFVPSSWKTRACTSVSGPRRMPCAGKAKIGACSTRL